MSLLDGIFGITGIFRNGVELFTRKAFDFVGPGWTLTDNPVTGRAEVAIDAEALGGGGGTSTFDALTDTPSSKTGQEGKLLAVGSGDDAGKIVYVTGSTGPTGPAGATGPSGAVGAAYSPLPLPLMRSSANPAASITAPAARHILMPIQAPLGASMTFSGVRIYIAQYSTSTGAVGVSLYRNRSPATLTYDLDEYVTMVNITSSAQVGFMDFTFATPKTLASGEIAQVDIMLNGINTPGSVGFTVLAMPSSGGLQLPGLGGVASPPNAGSSTVTVNNNPSDLPWFELIP